MRRLTPAALTSAALGLALSLLTACAPASQTATRTMTGTAQAPASTFRAAFSDAGVAWVSGGVACVARAPSFQPLCPRLPPVVDVAWNGGDAWAGVPGLGVVVTLDRAPITVPVGRVAALSSARVYREDGSAVTYAGVQAAGVIGTPSLAWTAPDGGDYVLLGGTLRRVADGVTLERSAADFITASALGVVSRAWPEVYGAAGAYRIRGDRLERLDAGGRVLASAPHGPGLVGLVGSTVVTVSPEGQVRAFTLELMPLAGS